MNNDLSDLAKLDSAQDCTKLDAQSPDTNFKEERRKVENRRKYVRYSVTAEAEIVEQCSRVRITGRASDLSRGGCYVDSVSCLPMGSTVYIRLRHSETTFQAKAMITYLLPGMGMGIAFTDIAEDQIEIVSKWIGELGGESVAEPKIESEEINSIFGLEQPTLTNSSSGWREAMAELIGLLTKRQVLTETEVAALLRKLLP
jgi:hypothetical protein